MSVYIKNNPLIVHDTSGVSVLGQILATLQAVAPSIDVCAGAVMYSSNGTQLDGSAAFTYDPIDNLLTIGDISLNRISTHGYFGNEGQVLQCGTNSQIIWADAVIPDLSLNPGAVLYSSNGASIDGSSGFVFDASAEKLSLNILNCESIQLSSSYGISGQVILSSGADAPSVWSDLPLPSGLLKLVDYVGTVNGSSGATPSTSLTLIPNTAITTVEGMILNFNATVRCPCDAQYVTGAIKFYVDSRLTNTVNISFELPAGARDQFNVAFTYTATDSSSHLFAVVMDASPNNITFDAYSYLSYDIIGAHV